MIRSRWLPFFLIAMAACSSESKPGGTPRDAGRSGDASPAGDSGQTIVLDAMPANDATPGGEDAAPADAIPGGTDTFSPGDGGVPEDVGPSTMDAAQPPADGGDACGTIGKECSMTILCESPLECADPPGVCIPMMRDLCGGFAGALCPPMYPECMYFAGADFGPCFTTAERACICAQPNANQNFPDCP